MRKLLIIIVLCLSSYSWATIAARQRGPGNYNSAHANSVTTTVQYGATTLAGSTLFCIVDADTQSHSSGTSSPTPSIIAPTASGLTWTLAVSNTVASSGSGLSSEQASIITGIYYIANAPSVPTSTVISTGASASSPYYIEVNVILAEFTGIASSPLLTTTVGSNQTTNTLIDAGSITLGSTALVFVHFYTILSGSFIYGSGYCCGTSLGGTQLSFTGSDLSFAAGTYGTAIGAPVNLGPWTAVAVSFTEAGGSGPQPVPRHRGVVF